MFVAFIRNAIRFSTIFLFGSTGEIITEKSGHLNMGTPGIMCLGGIGAVLGERLYLLTIANDVDLINPFLCVLFPMAGCLINRKTKKINVKPVNGFVPTTWIALIIIGLGMVFVVVSAFANVIITAGWANDIGKQIIDSSGTSVTYTQEMWNTEMLGSAMTLVVLAIFLCICTIPSIFEVKRDKAIARGKRRINRNVC